MFSSSLFFKRVAFYQSGLWQTSLKNRV